MTLVYIFLEKLEVESSSQDNEGCPPRKDIWFGVGDPLHNFKGRKEELEDVHARIHTPNETTGSSTAIAIAGLGGLGKTSLARWYAWQYKNQYDAIIWVNSDSISAMKTCFDQLIMYLGLNTTGAKPGNMANVDLARAVYEDLQQLKSLFIFDNVEEWKDFDQFRPKNLNPSDGTSKM